MEEFFVDQTSLKLTAGILGDFVGTTDLQIITGKKFDDALKVKPVSTPTTDALYGIYFCDSGDLNKPKFKKPDGTVIDLSASASGEANTASNIGSSGTGVWKDKNGVDLRFYKLNSLSSGLTIALDAGNNKIDFDLSGVALLASANTFTAAQKISLDTGGGLFTLHRPSSTVGNGSRLRFSLLDSSPAEQDYGEIRAEIGVNTAGAEMGRLLFSIANNGSLDVAARIDETTGAFRCGGFNTRARFLETGLTSIRDYTFPNVTTQLAGLASANEFTAAQKITANVSPLLTLYRTGTNFGPEILFSAHNASAAEKEYGRIKVNSAIETAGAEYGDMEFQLTVNGTIQGVLGKFATDGSFECGSLNRRIKLIDTGLTAQKTFLFPDISDQLTTRNFALANPYSGSVASVRRTGIFTAIASTQGSGIGSQGITAIGTPADVQNTTEGFGQSYATGAVANANAGLRWTQTRFRREWGMYMALRVAFSSTSDIRVFIGWSSNTAEIAGETTLNNNSGVGVGKRTGDTNWFTYRNDGDTTEDRVDTTIPFATSFVTIELELDSTSFRSRIGGTLQSAQTTELPAATTMLAPHVEIETGAGAADKTITILPIWFSISPEVMIV